MPEFKGEEGYTIFQHQDLSIEFLIEDKGKRKLENKRIKKLGITPQPLKYLNLLTQNLVKINYRGLELLLPHPINYALHKLIVSKRRNKKFEKSTKDREQSIKLIKDIIDNGEVDKLKQIYNSFNSSWKRDIKRELVAIDDDEIKEILKIIL